MQYAPAFFLEICVDAFLDHNFGDSVSFYLLFLLAKSIHGMQGPDSVKAAYFFQCCLNMPDPANPPPRSMTPWGLPYICLLYTSPSPRD